MPHISTDPHRLLQPPQGRLYLIAQQQSKEKRKARSSSISWRRLVTCERQFNQMEPARNVTFSCRSRMVRIIAHSCIRLDLSQDNLDGFQLHYGQAEWCPRRHV